MRRGIAIAAGVLLLAASAAPDARADAGTSGSMSIPVSLADLAAAAGIHRVDPATLPIDIVRIAFSSPDEAEGVVRRRTAIAKALDSDGDSGDRMPLPLSPGIWRRHVLRAEVPDARLASAILGRRTTALLYHGVLALDPETLAWIEANPAILDTFLKHPGAAAVYARSIHIRNGAVVTPGDETAGIWTGIVGADPANPASFIAKLLAARDGMVAAFYDAVAHLDATRQRFLLGAPGDPQRRERARKLFEAAMRELSPWHLDDYPFVRPDVDVAVLFRQVALDNRGIPAGPSSRRLWARVFGETDNTNGAIDAEWLAANLLKRAPGVTRRRLDTFLFAQRALSSDAAADPAALVAALQDFHRYPALMLTLETNGAQTAAAYAAAGRAAAALGRDEEAIAVFQGGLAVVDRGRLSGLLGADDARTLIASLTHAAVSRSARDALLSWLKDDLLTALRRSSGVSDTRADGAEALVLRALSGSDPIARTAVAWEGQQYFVGLAASELRRLTQIRRSQREPPLEEALRSATSRNLSVLASSLTALIYATAIGEPDSPAARGGAVWRRHRFGGATRDLMDSPISWRLATEVFGPDGWYLSGSLLKLDLALAHFALRRLDPTEMPAVSALSTMDRRTLAMTVALIDARAITDEARDAAAAALGRGRERVMGLAARPETLDAIADVAALSEWRRSGLRWLLARDAARVPEGFSPLELFRLGGGALPPGWGAAAVALDGCFCLRLSPATAWEEYAGRPSSGQLATQLADLMLRTAQALSVRRLPARLMRDVAAFAMQDAMDASRPGYFDDWLSVAFAARDLGDDRFDDYVAALTAAGPLIPVPKK
jgi:hypothetical protein